MEVEREPFDAGAELALEPRRPLVGDIAERSDVVAPDRDDVAAVFHERSVAAVEYLPAADLRPIECET
jgi:hypothetical protein